MKKLIKEYLTSIEGRDYEGQWYFINFFKWEINKLSYRVKLTNMYDKEQFEFSFVDFEDFKYVIENSNF
jgi:hypothetical protein